MATTGPRPTDPADLQNAVEDSHYLLAYFSRKKVDIPENKRYDFKRWIKVLSSFPSDTSSSTPDQKSEFWEAFIGLSDLADPATIEGIRYYFEYKERRWFRPFAIVTSIALIMTLGLGLLSYIGTTALLGYDGDYAHWSQMQMLVRYLAEDAVVTLINKEDRTGENGSFQLSLTIQNRHRQAAPSPATRQRARIL